MTFDSPKFTALLDALAAKTGDLESTGAWPAEQLDLLSDADVLGWMIPQQFGGSGLTSADITEGYYALAKSCLVTAFVLTQRNAAVQRIVGSENEAAREKFLPALCTSKMFSTVGISHLTTSRQHLGKPSVAITPCDGGYTASGFVPWTSGAAYADFVLTGGTLPDGQQVLLMVSGTADGFTVKPPASLLALNASYTGAAELSDVFVPDEDVIAGPKERVLKQGKGHGTGSLTTSALALGTAAASVARLGEEAARRDDLIAIHDQLSVEHATIYDDMQASLLPDADLNTPNLSSESIRQRANSFVLRCSQAYLAASKGAGFAKGHPAEQAVREAMFFMVWSCPQPVVAANLRELACIID
ncbi:acyl-CoA/acyl-ACP dehydrogenase [bacterium]|nr:acyl-CoA/acyl-ACP dehydrogenase [bacterium]